MLTNMPKDLILLRRVVPQRESIEKADDLGGRFEITVSEDVRDTGKVFASYIGRIRFDYEKVGGHWMLAEVTIWRPASSQNPLRLTQFLDEQSLALRKTLRQ
jgi:hypothetical protein